MVRKTLGLVAASLVVLACSGSNNREGFNEGASTGTGKGNANENGNLGKDPPPAPPPEVTECEKMDILFIVDDSGSMSEEQSNLATNFPKFISKIDTFKTKSGSKLDWRIAVTTTARNISYTVEMQNPFGGPPVSQKMSEKGDDGAFRMKSECGTTRRWVEKADPDAAKAFQCLAKTGTGGSGLEMPLYATQLALTDRMADGTNKGFLREDALLAVVILTDEDDCSREDNNFTVQNDACADKDVQPITKYKAVLDQIAQGTGRWATAVIAGESACQSSFGKATEAKRLKDFVGLAGKNGVFASICDGDLTPALEKALDTFDAACKALPSPGVK